jgi:hypothetical protein
MNHRAITTPDYVSFIKEIKQHVSASRSKAALSVNQELIRLYWYLGERIVLRQKRLYLGRCVTEANES